MPSFDSSSHNIGELVRTGLSLSTREVLALVHEACRDATAAFPQSTDDLWLTDTGELLIAVPGQPTTPVDPRNGVAALLESMLPSEGDQDPLRSVPASLRGLPQRLRATKVDSPQARRDLMSILSWHVQGDPREVVQQLLNRVSPAAAVAEVADDFDLFNAEEPSHVTAAAPAPADLPLAADLAPVAAPARRPLRATMPFALAALAILLVALGASWYGLFRSDAGGTTTEAVIVAGTDVPLEPETASIAAPRVRPKATLAAASGSAPQLLRLDARDGAFSPTFAATGRELYFHAGRSAVGRLLVADLDSTGQVVRVSALRDDGARDYHPRVSPDGRWLAFDSDRDGERGVYLAERAGGSLRRVSGEGYAAVPSWSPDMTQLAFVRGERSRPRVWNLWLRDLSTGALQRHTSFRSGQVWGASWFPDGRSLCYSHEQQLVISHLDAREDIVIDTPRRGHIVRTPAVSPDGNSVIFQVFKDGVWLLDVATRSMRRILDDPTAEEFAWWPDGRRVAYHSRRDGAWKIWVMGVTR